MSTDPFQRAWQAQRSGGRLLIDAEFLLREVQRNERSFARTLLWRDAREVGIALVMLPVWIAMGYWMKLPWTWYLMMPVLVWYMVFLLAHRQRGRQFEPQPDDTLRERVARSLGQIDHQIWLLKNVRWWALPPFGLAAIAFVGHVAWQIREGGWAAMAIMLLVLLQCAVIMGLVDWVNQRAIRTELLPRRAELLALDAALAEDATPPESVAT